MLTFGDMVLKFMFKKIMERGDYNDRILRETKTKGDVNAWYVQPPASGLLAQVWVPEDKSFITGSLIVLRDTYWQSLKTHQFRLK